MSIGDRLKSIRKSKGFSQDSLADQLGCSRGVITNIERNLTTPSALVLKGISDVLNIREEWLLHGTGDTSPDDQLSEKAKVTSEIYTLAKDLSEEEQLYILDLINTFKKHKGNFPMDS